jgi:hypothetical protein
MMGEVAVYAIVEVATGLVTSVIMWDGETPFGLEDHLIAIKSDKAMIGGFYIDGTFTRPPGSEPIPLTPAQITDINSEVRDQLLDKATRAINPLQDAVDNDDATPAEVALLKKWKQYRTAVNRVNLVLENPNWPSAPV